MVEKGGKILVVSFARQMHKQHVAVVEYCVPNVGAAFLLVVNLLLLFHLLIVMISRATICAYHL